MNKTIELTEKPIIEACLRSTHDLLTHYWGDITRIRDAKDNFVSVTMSFKIDTTGDSPQVKTRIGFSRRYGDTQEITVDTNQTEFIFVRASNSQHEDPDLSDSLNGLSLSVAGETS